MRAWPPTSDESQQSARELREDESDEKRSIRSSSRDSRCSGGPIMPSTDRVEILNPHQDLASESWNVGDQRVESDVSRVGPGAIDRPKPSGERCPFHQAPAPSRARRCETSGESLDGEDTVWEGQTSTKIYLVRILVGAFCSLAWGCLAVATWGFGYSNLAWVVWATAVVPLVFWVITAIKLFRAVHSHHYRLTSRRLIVRTGLFAAGSTRSSCCVSKTCLSSRACSARGWESGTLW